MALEGRKQEDEWKQKALKKNAFKKRETWMNRLS